MITPIWANQILDGIAKKKGKYRKRPELIFRRSNYPHGFYRPAGWRNNRQIVIFATESVASGINKEMLLHEISHWLTPVKTKAYFNGEKQPRRQWHTVAFYRRLFRYCQEYHLEYADYKSEFWYMPRSSKIAFSQVYGVSWLPSILQSTDKPIE